MAGIDKLYGSSADRAALIDWIENVGRKDLIDRILPERDDPYYAIANFLRHQDRFLRERCPLKFVTERISEQYRGRP